MTSEQSFSESELATMADALERSGMYRVQRRLRPRPKLAVPPNTDLRRGIFLDVETTGLDPLKDEVTEIAMVPFSFSRDGTIYEVHEAFQSFNQPKNPIPVQITKLTGITNEMVAGHFIKPADLEGVLNEAALVIAHNAAFDRRFAEKLSPEFALKAWACSQSQIDWSAEGIEGTRLPYLLTHYGYFYDKHRALNDCLAALELLASPLPISKVTGLSRLLENARKPTWRIWAENTPYDSKDELKARGYKWNPDGMPHPKAWFIDVSEESRDAELAYLRQAIYRRDVDPLVQRIDAFNRFSERS